MDGMAQSLATTTTTRGLQNLTIARLQSFPDDDHHEADENERTTTDVIAPSTPGIFPIDPSHIRCSASQDNHTRSLLGTNFGRSKLRRPLRYAKIIGSLLLGVLGVTATWWGLQLAMWTAVKEFREDCREMNATTGHVSFDCVQALSQSLEAPPVLNWRTFLHTPSVPVHPSVRKRTHPRSGWAKLRDWANSDNETRYRGMPWSKSINYYRIPIHSPGIWRQSDAEIIYDLSLEWYYDCYYMNWLPPSNRGNNEETQKGPTQRVCREDYRTRPLVEHVWEYFNMCPAWTCELIEDLDTNDMDKVSLKSIRVESDRKDEL